jgi:hypothetical protein
MDTPIPTPLVWWLSTPWDDFVWAYRVPIFVLMVLWLVLVVSTVRYRTTKGGG